MKQILLADHNSELRSALRLFLETRFEFNLIIEARDMEHVLAQVEDTRPDCLIFDWELPGRPIRERIKVLRTLLPGLRIIVTSTHPESKDAAISEGADEFISKGDPPEKILEAIQNSIKEWNKP